MSSFSILLARIFACSSPAVLPVKLSQRLAFQLAYIGDYAAIKEGVTSGQEEEQEQINHIQGLYKQMVSESSVRSSFALRNLLVARLLGRAFEAKLWTLVASRTEGGVEEGRNFDIFCDKVRYLRLQEETCGLHLNRAADRKSRAAVTARHRLWSALLSWT